MKKRIKLPITKDVADQLKIGDYVYLSGEMYVARDAAHKRIIECIENNEELPIQLMNETIYYMGPSPARDKQVIGSAGPTTSSRMDKYATTLMDLGLKGMVGKGKRSQEVLESIVKNHAVYFAAIGGEGALLSKKIVKSQVIAYDDLGAEAIRRIEVEDFPVIVVADNQGGNLYEEAVKKYMR